MANIVLAQELCLRLCGIIVIDYTLLLHHIVNHMEPLTCIMLDCILFNKITFMICTYCSCQLFSKLPANTEHFLFPAWLDLPTGCRKRS